MRIYLSQFILLACLLMLLLLGACNSQPTNSNLPIINQLACPDAVNLYKSRSASKKLNTPSSFCLIYEGDLETLLADKSSLSHLIQEYNLEIADYFEVSKDYSGLTLQAHASLPNAVQIGKTLSLINQVSMITIKNSVEEYM